MALLGDSAPVDGVPVLCVAGGGGGGGGGVSLVMTGSDLNNMSMGLLHVTATGNTGGSA